MISCTILIWTSPPSLHCCSWYDEKRITILANLVVILLAILYTRPSLNTIGGKACLVIPTSTATVVSPVRHTEDWIEGKANVEAHACKWSFSASQSLQRCPRQLMESVHCCFCQLFNQVGGGIPSGRSNE